MAQVHGTHKAPKLASEEDFDFISRMPENVITNILNRLPIQNAVGTSILSRNWRFKWNMVTQLVFDNDFFCYLEGKKKYSARIIISRLLIHFKGPITKFVLDITESGILDLDVEDVNHLVLFLSRKGIKELTLMNMSNPLKLSSHIFSCQDLKHLTIENCSFHVAPNYCGYPNLLSLKLDSVTFKNGNCGEIINQCPLLELLEITGCYDAIGKVKLAEIGKVKLANIGKLENLKILDFPMSVLDNVAITRSTIFHLGCYHPQLQELTLNFYECKFLGEGETCAKKLVHTIFPCLKTLVLYPINFNSCSMVSCVIKMISGSPNLKSLKIWAQNEDDVPPPPHALTSLEADYKTLGQLQLQNLDFTCWGSENEVVLIKYLFSSSPLLKKIAIHLCNLSGMSNETLTFAAKLLKLRRASPLAEVTLIYFQ